MMRVRDPHTPGASEHCEDRISYMAPAGEPITIRMAYVVSGTKLKLRFRAINPADLAEFMDLLFGTTSVRARVEEIIWNNECNNA